MNTQAAPIQAQLADGRVLEFPAGTDPQVIQSTVKKMMAQQNQQPAPQSDTPGQLPQGSDFEGVLQAVATIANPLPLGASVAGGLASLPVFVAEQFGLADEGAAVDLINTFKSAAEYKPTTQAGMQKLQTFMSSPPMQKMSELMQSYEEGMGYLAETTSPEYGAMIKGLMSTPQALPIAAGLKASEKAINAIPQRASKQDIGRQLIEGQTNANTAGYRLKNTDLREQSMETRKEQYIDDVPDYSDVKITGDTDKILLDAPNQPQQAPLTKKELKIEKFPEAKSLKKQGFDDNVIAGIQQYTRDESRLAAQMAKIKSAAKENINIDRQPLSIVGETLKDQVKIISNARTIASKKVGAALNDMKGKNLNYGGVLEDWRRGLEKEGIKITQDIGDNGVDWSVDLRGSKFAGDTGAQKLLDLVADRLSLIVSKEGSFNSATAKDLHDLKKLIDYRVNWSRMPGDDGLTVEAESLAKTLRGGINEILKKGSSKYEQANADYAKAIQPLVKLNESTGRKVDILNDDLSPAKLGQEMRKTIGNWNVTEDLKDAAKAISLEAKARGYDKNINLDRLVILNGILDKRFGVSASKGGTLGALVEPVARGDAIGAGINAGKAGLDKIRRVNDKQAMEDLIRLLSKKSAEK
jgi:hypothetical protein